jgi:hypothetical protein
MRASYVRVNRPGNPEAQMTADVSQKLIPLSEAALSLKMSRERVLRRVQEGSIPGVCLHGRWYVLVNVTETAPKSAA